MKKGADTDICCRGPSVDRPEIGIARLSNGGTRRRVIGDPASEFALTFGRGYDFAQQVDNKDAARRRTVIDLYRVDGSHHLVIKAPGLDHRANANRARQGLISLHRHLCARYGRHTPETIHTHLLYSPGVTSYSPSNTSTSSSRSAASPRAPKLRRSIAMVLITAKTSHPGVSPSAAPERRVTRASNRSTPSRSWTSRAASSIGTSASTRPARTFKALIPLGGAAARITSRARIRTRKAVPIGRSHCGTVSRP